MTVTTAPAPHTDPTTIPATVARCREAFDAGVTRPIEWRLAQLGRLDALLEEREADLVEALAVDLGKSSFEAYATDVGFVRNEIRHLCKHVARWARPRRVRTPVSVQPATAKVVPEPLGVVLVVAPWNYPVQLVVVPMAAALAAGNAVVAKPSELAPHVSATLAGLLEEYVDPGAVQVVQGGVDETTTLLEQRFDHVFYTGSGRVGRIVMEAAARHLTPVTLELGGKSPAIVAADADLDVAAKRIAFGKFMNAGQTCVAPDYVLVDRAVEEPLLERLAAAVRSFYGDDPRRSPDYGRIVNDAHFARLEGLLDDGRVVVGGERDAAQRYLAPTVLRDVDPDGSLMRDEIFGPILPVVAVDGVDDAIDVVNRGDRPLALYVFSGSEAINERVLAETSSGGACVNGTMMHLAVPDLPFGGVGASGFGAYHGKAGFDTFSHEKSVLTRSTRLDTPLAYPPFTRAKEWLVRRFL